MKVIKLTESQFKKIIMFESTVPSFNGGDLKEYPGSETSVTANVTNSDGEKEYGEPTDADKIQKKLAIQNYWANASNGARLQP